MGGQELLVQSLENRRDEIVGVSIDEELMDLMKYQRSYQSAARFVCLRICRRGSRP